ncbi:MAG: cupin domain-containing protein [Chloroflexi bacterium]|nr:cupin domain-containing protein [Chloroflexota bacterium]
MIDLARVGSALTGPRPLWTDASTDLNINLVRLEPGDGVGEHVNSEVDVLLVAIAGGGVVTLEGVEQAIQAGEALLLAKGSRRALCAGDEPFVYLLCHRRRQGLWPQPKAERR